MNGGSGMPGQKDTILSVSISGSDGDGDMSFHIIFVSERRGEDFWVDVILTECLEMM